MHYKTNYILFISLNTGRDLSENVIFAKSCRDDINPIIIVQNQLRYYCCGNKKPLFTTNLSLMTKLILSFISPFWTQSAIYPLNTCLKYMLVCWFYVCLCSNSFHTVILNDSNNTKPHLV